MTGEEDSETAIQVVLKEFERLVGSFENSVEKGYLFAGGVLHKGDVKNTPYLNEAFELGKSI